MSWDSKALAVMAVTWIAFGVVYDVLMQMPAGARGWMSGGAILIALLVALWRIERRARIADTLGFDSRHAVVGEAD